jgi:hypothetical protein
MADRTDPSFNKDVNVVAGKKFSPSWCASAKPVCRILFRVAAAGG